METTNNITNNEKDNKKVNPDENTSKCTFGDSSFGKSNAPFGGSSNPPNFLFGSNNVPNMHPFSFSSSCPSNSNIPAVYPAPGPIEFVNKTKPQKRKLSADINKTPNKRTLIASQFEYIQIYIEDILDKNDELQKEIISKDKQIKLLENMVNELQTK